MKPDANRTEHPSFGVITINRVEIGGRAKTLFDSPFQHHHVISIEISPACHIRNLHGDTIMPSGRLPHVKVSMSEVQFSQMMLNAGRFGGTPCTIDELEGKPVPPPPQAGMKQLWSGEIKKEFQELGANAERAENGVEALLGKDRVTKADLKAVRDLIRKMAQDIRENIPWMQERFQEAMEKTVASAKGEINAHLTSTIDKAGLSALKGKDAIGIEFRE
jgi:hypothetical protein